MTSLALLLLPRLLPRSTLMKPLLASKLTSRPLSLGVRSKFYLPRGEGFPSPPFFFMVLCTHTRDFG
nr:MAG TPA: hypothetical protein [Caudoviricetes sp.]